MRELTQQLKTEFPYISAVESTWDTYARILAAWLDLSDLAVLDESRSGLVRYEEGTQVRDRSLSFAPRRSGMTVPSVHFTPVVQVATRLATAVQQRALIDWSGIRRSTVYKALSMLEELGLITRTAKTISVSPECSVFVTDSQRRVGIAQAKALEWPMFKAFVSILKEQPHRRMTHKRLAAMMGEKASVNWKPSTGVTNVKIMLDWARHLQLVPGALAKAQRGKFSRPSDGGMPLFGFKNAQESEGK